MRMLEPPGCTTSRVYVRKIEVQSFPGFEASQVNVTVLLCELSGISCVLPAAGVERIGAEGGSSRHIVRALTSELVERPLEPIAFTFQKYDPKDSGGKIIEVSETLATAFEVIGFVVPMKTEKKPEMGPEGQVVPHVTGDHEALIGTAEKRRHGETKV